MIISKDAVPGELAELIERGAVEDDDLDRLLPTPEVIAAAREKP